MLYLVHFISLLAYAISLPTANDDIKSKYLITSLPGFKYIPTSEIPIMYSGQILINKTSNTNYFFWKVENKESSNNHLTFWFNGGPGCSSMEGALMENGPFKVKSDSSGVYPNDGSWHKVSNMVYVDQPGGVGLSTTDKYYSDLNQVRDYFLKFLQSYFEIFPEDSTKDIYLAGESYAGQYIPYIADGVMKSEFSHKLKGLLIGNGSVSPIQQSLSFLPLYIKLGLFSKDSYGYDIVREKHDKCEKIVEKIDETFNDGLMNEYETNRTYCSSMLSDLKNFTLNLTAPEGQQCVDIYNYKLRDSYPSCGSNIPTDKAKVYKFLNDEKVQTLLHVEHKSEWVTCNANVSDHFNNLVVLPAVHLLPNLIENLNVILFSGGNDIVCNTKGALLYLNKLEWNGSKGFTKSREDYVFDDEVVGWILEDRGLKFFEIFDASHMVPWDKPIVSRNLLEELIKDSENKNVLSNDKGQNVFKVNVL
ncbi:unnamed protein product [Candida verbasci]|uniref:Carboxypeptidase n=1 Tax=Candida verbasci TaxID=1227364 RepID=A0A9W4U039_9ASCO|nr:unnamed protein product [Candida verbasci]